MSRTHAPLITLVVGIALILHCWQPSTAHATTFVMMDEETLLHSSDAVVVGTVTAIESAVDANGELYTYVHVQPERIIKGSLAHAPLIVREPGGMVGERREWIFGVPEFWAGERTLLFLSRNPDGTLQTNSLSMGKYMLGVNVAGQATAMRNLGEESSVLNPATGHLADAQPESQRLLPFLKRLRHLARRPGQLQSQPIVLTPPELAAAVTEVHENFTFLGGPARWFEPDTGLPVNYLIDATGDNTLGFATSRAAADQALAVWTDVPTSNLILADGGTTVPIKLNDCGNTTNRIVWNDPWSEITDPSGCSGVLATSGWCGGSGTKVVNGTTFSRIAVARLMVNNGWGGCTSTWTQCNLAETLTHEIGHTIGFGHSSENPNEPNPVLKAATMYWLIHFDGRCAGLKADDIAAVNFSYPQTGTPMPTATVTNTPPPAATPSLTATRTPTASPTRTSSPVPSSTPVQTPTRTETPTRTTTATPTRTPTLAASPTRTFTFAPGSFTITGNISYYSNAQPVAGTTVRVIGSPNPGELTDASGQFSCPGLGTTGIQLEPQMSAGIGTAISALDASYILQGVTGLITLSPEQRLACDVTGNGTLSALDAALILQYKVGMIASFPVAQACGSDWAFVPVPAPAQNQLVIQPAIATGSCGAGAISYQPLAGSDTGQDFHAIVFGDCTGNWQPGVTGAATYGGASAATVHLGRARTERHGKRVRVPVYVQSAGPLHALDIEVQYDPNYLTPMGARRVGSARQALIAFNQRAPGVLAVSLASGQPLHGGAALLLQFDVKDSRSPHTALRLVHAEAGEN